MVAFGAVAIVGGLGAAHAQTTTSTSTNAFPIMTNAPSYTGSATIVVSGNYSAASFVSVTIDNPKGGAITSQNPATQANGTFSATFQASWLLGWNVSGTYTALGSYSPPDYTGPPITASVTFLYTAVPPTTTSTSTSTSTPPLTTSSTSSGPAISAIDLVPLVVVVVIVIGVVGFLLRSRGRRATPSRSAARPTSK